MHLLHMCGGNIHVSISTKIWQSNRYDNYNLGCNAETYATCAYSTVRTPLTLLPVQRK